MKTILKSLFPSVGATLAAGLLFFLEGSVVAGDRQMLHGHVPSITAQLQPLGRAPATDGLRLAISLPLRNRDTLTNLLEQLYDPARPNFHHFLTPEQFAQTFGPTEEDYEAVVGFAQSYGLSVTARHPNRTLVSVSGNVAAVEQAFHVTLNVYQHPTESRTFYAPSAAPSLDLTTPVLGISGLDNYVAPHRLLKPASLGQGTHPQTGAGPGGSYLGNDFRAAYVPGVTLTGAGQTVGLLEFDSGYYPSDITAYETQAGLPNVPVNAVLLDGYNGAAGGGNDEVSLDIEAAMAMAPGLNQILVYEGTTTDDILNRMATDNIAKQISASWSYGIDAESEQIYQQYAAQGQSFFNASGDGDAWSGPIYTPCDDPNITIVGGTELSTSGPGGAWTSETVWNDGYSPPGWANTGYWGSSGGISTVYSIPSWQAGGSMSANHGSTTMRNVPDVALTADNVYVTYGDGESGGFGGTSCAAPLWAGLTALVNQQRAANGRPPVGFLNPAIYAVGQGANYTASFHDITTGNNATASSGGLFPAVPGYDLCTGWGTPNGSNLINALAGFALPPTNPIITWPNPAAIAYGVPLNYLQLNATANVAGSFAYNPPSGAILNPGANTLSVIFTPADTEDYYTVTNTVNLAVLTHTTFWDPGFQNASPGSGGLGTWDNSTANWWLSGTGDVVWSTGGDYAAFGGSAGTVTLGDNVSADGLRFNTDGYIIAGTNTLTLNGPGNIIVPPGNETIIRCALGGVGYTVSGGGVLYLNNPANSSGNGSSAESVVGPATTLQVKTDHNVGTAGDTLNLENGGVFQNVDPASGDPLLLPGSSLALLAGGGVLNNPHASLTMPNLITGPGSLTYTGAGGYTLTVSDPVNNYSGGTILQGPGELIASAGGALGSTSGPLTVSGGTLDLGGSSHTVGGVTISGGTIQDGTLTGSSYAGQSGTVSAVLSGAGAMTQTTAGTLVLTGVNTYSGGTTIGGGGVYQIAADSALGAASSPLTLNGGCLKNNGSAPVLNPGRTIVLGTGGGYMDAGWGPGQPITVNGQITGPGQLFINLDGSPVVLGNTGNNYTGGTVIGVNGPGYLASGSQAWLKLGASGVIPNGSGYGNVTINQNYFGLLDLAGFSQTINGLSGDGTVNNSIGNGSLSVGNNNQSSAFSGVIENTGGALALAKIGTGVLTLTGVNTYSGGTTISGGVCQIAADSALGATSSPLTLNGGCLKNNGSAITINSSRIVTLGTSGGYVDAGWGPGNPVTINGKISGAGELIIDLDGSPVVLANAGNNYTGDTVVGSGGPGSYASGNQAWLKLGASGVIPNGPGYGNVTINQTYFGLLDLGGFSQTINGLSGNGTVNNSTGAASLSVGNNNQSSAFGGVIENTGGALALAKIGAGVLTLNGVNTYSGLTTIGAGTLALGGGGSINNSSMISIAAGATLDVSAIPTYVLGGSTTLSASAATIKGGGTVSLGSKPISLTYMPSAFSGDASHPALYISQGTLALNGNAFTVNNASGTPLGAGVYVLIQQAGGNVAGSGTYSVSVTGSGVVSGLGASIQVSGGNVNLVVSAPLPPVIQFVYPPVINELAGDHVAFQVSATGAAPLLYQWYHANVALAGQTSSALVLTNIQTADSGQYQVTVVNGSGIYVTDSVTLNVSATPLPLYSTNLVVLRVGDGAQNLSGGAGNTVYLDQYTTAGVYVSSLMVPDESAGSAYGTGSSASVYGSPALLLPGAGNDYSHSGLLTLSSNQQFLAFAGYCANYPFGGSDLTVGSSSPGGGGGSAYARGLATVDAAGHYILAYTNSGLYSGGNHSIRNAFTLDGTNFWTTGQALSGGVKYANTQNAIYSGGSGIPYISTASTTGTRAVQIFGTNLIFSDASGPSGSGLYICNGTPEPAAGGTATATLLLNEGGQPNDFAVSPDGRTIYIADSQAFVNASTRAGGIQRWDTNTTAGGYAFSYTLPVNQASGAQGVTVSFPTNITTWGGNVLGAQLFATSSTNLSAIVDNGPSSIATLLFNTAPLNELLHGVRFAPLAASEPPVIQTVTLAAGSLAFTWTTLANRMYQIQATAGLSPAGWINLGAAITATSSTTTVSETIGTNSQQFYRVVLLP